MKKFMECYLSIGYIVPEIYLINMKTSFFFFKFTCLIKITEMKK